MVCGDYGGGVREVDSEAEGGARSAEGRELEVMADLAIVRADLAAIEAIEDELRQRLAHLRATLPLGQFRLVWALLDAQERLGLAERLLTERAATGRAPMHGGSDAWGRPDDGG